MFRVLKVPSSVLTALAAVLVAAGASHAQHDHHDDHGHGGDPDHGDHSGHAHDAHGQGHDHDDATATHRFENPEAWANRFEDPERDAWQQPDRVVEALVTRDDVVIVDIGSATGYFPVRFARAAKDGQVYGADVEPGMVHYLNDRARRERIHNLVSILAAADDPHVPQPVDIVFLCNTYHHINDRVDYFTRLADQLRPGGRVAVVDYRLESERGPNHKLAPEKVEAEMVAAGYVVAARHDFLPDQYFLVFERSESE